MSNLRVFLFTFSVSLIDTLVDTWTELSLTLECIQLDLAGVLPDVTELGTAMATLGDTTGDGIAEFLISGFNSTSGERIVSLISVGYL